MPGRKLPGCGNTIWRCCREQIETRNRGIIKAEKDKPAYPDLLTFYDIKIPIEQTHYVSSSSTECGLTRAPST
jgi:hypothetical protein